MVEITLKGTGLILQAIEDSEDSGEMYEFGVIQSDVLVLNGEEDITKKKGKYLKSKNILIDKYFKPISGDSDTYFVRAINEDFDFEVKFHIDIEPEEFDPKKLQLIKSDYEIDLLPYAIIMDVIMYDGKEIKVIQDIEYS